jgi:hypothetical protein
MNFSRFSVCGVPLTALLLSGPVCGGISVPDAQYVENVPGSDAEKSVPFLTAGNTLQKRGYIEAEFLISGTANVYEYVDDAQESAAIEVIESGLDYTTRILVRAPENPRRFNGTVLLDILNATRGYDGEISWVYSGNTLMDEGAVYVGITSKASTVRFLRDEFGRPPYKPRNASRYATLKMPDSGQIWDILSQVSALLKDQANPDNPLYQLNVERIILTGHSQSASYVKTFVNSFHRDALLNDGRSAIDGYIENAGSFSAKRVNVDGAAGENFEFFDKRNKAIVPVPAPVFRVQSETEPNSFFASRLSRQTEADSPWVRTYEIAGGAHVGATALALENEQNFNELGLGPARSCEVGPSTLPVEQAFSALFVRMDRWLRDGDVPPASRLIALVENESGRVIEKDFTGNTVGGIRLPQLEVPIGRWSGGNPDLFCFLYGSFVPYTQSELDLLYPRRGDYIKPLRASIRAAVNDGFLLPRGAHEIWREARRRGIGKQKNQRSRARR